HLRAASAVARVFRALSAAGAAGRAALPHDEESGPLLQPPVPLDVRAVRARHVSARPRTDGEWRRRRGRGPCVGVRALSNRLDPASASVVVGLDAVVLFGLRRHFATGRIRPLAGAAAAWIAQNLSCGYYLLFFSPSPSATSFGSSR